MGRPRKVTLNFGEQPEMAPQSDDVQTLAERIVAAQDGADHATQCALRSLQSALTDLQMRATAADIPADIAERITNL